MSRTIDDKDKPVFMKNEVEAQLPLLKKQNLKNNSYAVKSVQELFTKEQLQDVQVKQVNYTSSCVAFNN